MLLDQRRCWTRVPWTCLPRPALLPAPTEDTLTLPDLLRSPPGSQRHWSLRKL